MKNSHREFNFASVCVCVWEREREREREREKDWPERARSRRKLLAQNREGFGEKWNGVVLSNIYSGRDKGGFFFFFFGGRTGTELRDEVCERLLRGYRMVALGPSGRKWDLLLNLELLRIIDFTIIVLSTPLSYLVFW